MGEGLDMVTVFLGSTAVGVFIGAGGLGMFVFCGTLAIMRYLSESKQSALTGLTTQISDAQLRMKRERAASSSFMFRLTLAFLPLLKPMSRKLATGQQREELLEWYRRAGYPGGLDEDEVLAYSYVQSFVLAIALAGVVAFGAFAVSMPQLFLLSILCLALGLLGPGIAKGTYETAAQKREKQINRVFPYVVDLLVLTMKSGASLSIAIERVTGDYRGHPVAEEFRAILSDIELGSTSRQAFENFGKRVPIKVVVNFVDDVLQSEELGQPVADALERLADRIRVRRIQDARATAGAAKVKVLIPSVLVMFAALILLFAPFIMTWSTGGFDQTQEGSTAEAEQ